MAQINVNNLTFYYEGSFDNVFENVSFSIDTNWRLGFIGRNGKGKTTFLNILLGKYKYQGSISTTTVFDYFPYQIPQEYMERCAYLFLEDIKCNCEEWKVICELDKLGVDAEVLYRPFNTLSHGERTKVMLAVLFSGENDFLLIDEPTNHLDKESRECVKNYLKSKKGFILVSHDRDLLDAVVDHVLVLNRKSIEVQNGNFASWWENKRLKDMCLIRENERHKSEISKLKVAARRASTWAEKGENKKIGFDPIKEHDRCKGTRSYIGAKTKKMQSRVKQINGRIEREIEEKEGLLQDIEEMVNIKVKPINHHKEILCNIKEYGLKYSDGKDYIFEDLNMDVRQGERIFLNGANGCGKSSLIKVLLREILNNKGSAISDSGIALDKYNENEMSRGCINKEKLSCTNIIEKGLVETASGITISYVNQDTSHLKGSIENYCLEHGLDRTLFQALLRQLDMDRLQFTKNIEDFSEGQKKKVLIAASLSISA